MGIEVYWASGSPVAWRVTLGLAVKQVEHTAHRLDLSAKEHQSEAFLAINPRGTFPVLVDGEFVLRESLAILVYLDRLHPDPPLFGRSVREEARVWEAIGDHDNGLGFSERTVTRGIFRKDGLRDPEPVRAAVAQAEKYLADFDTTLAERPWVAGDEISAADLFYYPTLHRFLRAASKENASEVGLSLEPLGDRFAAIDAWQARLAALPGVDDTYPPHWR